MRFPPFPWRKPESSAAPLPAPPVPSFALPLVSIIITAYNYGRFLDAAIASVAAQIYPEIECLVVNDGSADGTTGILQKIQAQSPDIKIITFTENRGQGAASRAGLRASRGQYIVFMDADDELAPDFVLTHIYVHLSSRLHAGFTSSDIWQTQDGRIVATTGEALNNYLRSHAPIGAGMFRALGPEAGMPPVASGPETLAGVRHVPPGWAEWCWSPMTGNLFRREIVELIADCDAFETLRIGTDVYLCTGVSLLCGSLLIDRPLSAYRIHGANQGSFQVQLDNMRTVRIESELSWFAKGVLLEHLVAQRHALGQRFWHEGPVDQAIETLRRDLPAPPARQEKNDAAAA
jgi:glycosyltransferase involved in cell wall biosynthesis